MKNNRLRAKTGLKIDVTHHPHWRVIASVLCDLSAEGGSNLVFFDWHKIVPKGSLRDFVASLLLMTCEESLSTP